MVKVFIDGKEGTTGLQLADRLNGRRDIELLQIDEALRKDTSARRDMLNAADFAFLCLPDAAAVEAVSLVENTTTKIIDASTAHRTASGWAYGFPELSASHRQAVVCGMRVAVPGCHASGFIAAAYPLVSLGIISPNYPFAVTSITGYSGGGKSMIAQYELGCDDVLNNKCQCVDGASSSPSKCGDGALNSPGKCRDEALNSPRQYGMNQTHKHLREMQAISGLSRAPIFEPYVASFYSGMEVTTPLFADMLEVKMTKQELFEMYSDYYNGQKLVSVEMSDGAFLAANTLRCKNNMRIVIGGNDERLLVSALYDNLGKGASGAAVQCFNLMTGADETEGLI